MTVEIISWSISTKVWDRAGIELATPGSAVRLASVARHVTDWDQLVLKIDLRMAVFVWIALLPSQHLFESCQDISWIELVLSKGLNELLKETT